MILPENIIDVRHIIILGDKINIHGIESSECSSENLKKQEIAFGLPFNQKLSSLRVVVIGLGGTGSPVATLLARTGVGELILIDGDGSFNMTYNDLMTIKELNLPIKIFIMNDSRLQMVHVWQDLFFDKRYLGTSQKNPNYSDIAFALLSFICIYKDILPPGQTKQNRYPYILGAYIIQGIQQYIRTEILDNIILD